MTLEAQLGLIGGTMGLLTGFSILSGVEIIYYLLRLVNVYHDVPFASSRLFLSFKTPKDMAAAVANKIRQGNLMQS